jgi:hypothetical protein
LAEIEDEMLPAPKEEDDHDSLQHYLSVPENEFIYFYLIKNSTSTSIPPLQQQQLATSAPTNNTQQQLPPYENPHLLFAIQLATTKKVIRDHHN